MWKDGGFDKRSTTYVEFKSKRNEYRLALRKFIQCKENSDIVDLCKASKVDKKLFWKMLKKGKGKGKTTFWLMESLSTQTRILPICGLIIFKHWENQLQMILIMRILELRLNLQLSKYLLNV